MEKTKLSMKDKLLNNSLYLILLAILIITVIIEPKFVSFRNLTNILQMASTRSIIAMGIAGLIIINALIFRQGV